MCHISFAVHGRAALARLMAPALPAADRRLPLHVAVLAQRPGLWGASAADVRAADGGDVIVPPPRWDVSTGAHPTGNRPQINRGSMTILLVALLVAQCTPPDRQHQQYLLVCSSW